MPYKDTLDSDFAHASRLPATALHRAREPVDGGRMLTPAERLPLPTLSCPLGGVIVRKTFRNAGLPRDLQTNDTVVEIHGLEFPLIAEPRRGVMTAFRVDFRGDPALWRPGTVEVAATLIRKTWDEERQTWCRDRIEYQVRASDLTPGIGGRAFQHKATDVYRLEFTAKPTNSTETDKPSYDFTKYEQIEINLCATACDGAVGRRRITCDLAPEEMCDESQPR